MCMKTEALISIGHNQIKLRILNQQKMIAIRDCDEITIKIITDEMNGLQEEIKTLECVA